MDESPTIKVLHPTAAQVRVLAHPLRWRLLGALRVHGPATATTLARRLGTNSGATSYHLRQLAEAGVVTIDDERSNGRERYWRATHEQTSWSSTDFDDDPDARAADDWLAREQARRSNMWVQDWLDRRHATSAAWRDAAVQSDYHLELSPAALKALMTELHLVIERHRGEVRDPPPPDAQVVTVLLNGFPTPDRGA